MSTKILLVDDDVDEHEFFALALQSVNENIQLRVAGDAILALEQLEGDTSFIPYYIFLDVNMPKMNGIQCVPELKKMAHLKNSKIVMYSTTLHNHVVEDVRKLGVDEFLIKPFKIAKLIEELKKIIQPNENNEAG